MIHCHDVNEIFRKRNIVIWLILAFKAGFLNAGGFLATGRFVSHITGFGTQIGIALGHDEFLFGVELLVIPLSFILGGFITSLILDHEHESGHIPPYYKVQFLITFILIIVLVVGNSGHLGQFTTAIDDLHDVVLLGFLCFLCGLQNGLITWSTYGKVRTTHLTGIATDFGLNLIYSFRPRTSKARFQERKRVNFLRFMTIVSFSTGSLIAAFIFPKYEYSAFAISLILSFALSIYSFIHYQQEILLEKKRGSHA